MQAFTLFLAAALLAAAARASAPSTSRHEVLIGRQSGIGWRACDLSSKDDLNNTRPILCGTLTVPLDYSDSKCASTINLPLLKVPAVNKATKKGSILVNFGGPGINGTEEMVGNGAKLQGIAGPDFDILTWHPRGTDGDLVFSCYANSTARNIANTVATPRILGNASNVADGELWANGEIIGATCGEAQKQNGSLIGTAYTARDAMQIVDALEEGGLIRYWGFSYGTLLGSTIAAMFPDRIGQLIIDGVVNPRSYYQGLVLTSRESSDDVLMGFAQGCVQTPQRCPLAHNYTMEQVYDNVLQTIDSIKASPAVISAPLALGGDYKIDYTFFKGIIYSTLYSPEVWSFLANFIEAVITRNSTFLNAYMADLNSQTREVDSEALMGIQCGDTFARASTLEGALAYLEPFRNNKFADVDDPTSLSCARWPFAAKGRYRGNFELKTKNPILVIGNTWDPATPLASAKNASLGFEGSVLLEQRGYGHTSLAQASLCTARRVHDYFNYGALPKEGTVCKVDEPFFPADQGASTWAYVLKNLAEGHLNGTTISSGK